ncbi:hypothetical protein NQ317_003037 [Molorchus minor]|uniref:Uncharacterized protein n=1 Tax=Molorchus minor TaxID=1323400 RepID=A0ABQ9JDY9_9CUCU|nr:hypothetical protein NQ317_003037 [Molorchus minor]
MDIYAISPKLTLIPDKWQEEWKDIYEVAQWTNLDYQMLEDSGEAVAAIETNIGWKIDTYYYNGYLNIILTNTPILNIFEEIMMTSTFSTFHCRLMTETEIVRKPYFLSSADCHETTLSRCPVDRESWSSPVKILITKKQHATVGYGGTNQYFF